MCGCADVDIIYVGTVQHLHVSHAMLALQNNKHVLVEKPLACTGAEAETLINEVDPFPHRTFYKNKAQSNSHAQ